MALTEVILREKIDNLGSEADVVKVKAGFARNFLIPQGKAYEATKGNLRQISNLHAARAKREPEDLNEAQDLASKIARTAIQLNKPLKSTGKTDVEIKVHPEVTTSVTITVAAAEEPKAAE